MNKAIFAHFLLVLIAVIIPVASVTVTYRSGGYYLQYYLPQVFIVSIFSSAYGMYLGTKKGISSGIITAIAIIIATLIPIAIGYGVALLRGEHAIMVFNEINTGVWSLTFIGMAIGTIIGIIGRAIKKIRGV